MIGKIVSPDYDEPDASFFFLYKGTYIMIKNVEELYYCIFSPSSSAFNNSQAIITEKTEIRLL